VQPCTIKELYIAVSGVKTEEGVGASFCIFRENNIILKTQTV
jgi:hypothetical protein